MIAYCNCEPLRETIHGKRDKKKQNNNAAMLFPLKEVTETCPYCDYYTVIQHNGSLKREIDARLTDHCLGHSHEGLPFSYTSNSKED